MAALAAPSALLTYLKQTIWTLLCSNGDIVEAIVSKVWQIEEQGIERPVPAKSP